MGKLKDFCAVQKNVGIEIWYNGGSRTDMERWMIERRPSEAALMLQEQPKGGLGLKLQLAAKQSLSQGRDYVVIIGRRFHSQFLTVLTYSFLARLHFSAEELLIYPRRQRRRPCQRRRRRPHAKC